MVRVRLTNSSNYSPNANMRFHIAQGFEKFFSCPTFAFYMMFLHKKLKLLVSLLFVVLLASCALQKTSTGLATYQQAMLCYTSKKYSEALPLFEEALRLLQGKREEAPVYFYRAYCSFYQKKKEKAKKELKNNYVQSADRFQYFRETFPRDLRIEEAMYMQGHALYLASPDVRLDQAFTQEAVHALRDYLNDYPSGTYWEKANVQLKELEHKLALKAFKNAKLYHQLMHYRAAVVALENFQKDFSNTPYHEEAAYLKADAQYRHCKEINKPYNSANHHRKVTAARQERALLRRESNVFQDTNQKRINILEEEGVQSHLPLKEVRESDAAQTKEQVSIAIKYCQEFLDQYSGSQYTLAVQEFYTDLFSLKVKSLNSIKHP